MRKWRSTRGSRLRSVYFAAICALRCACAHSDQQPDDGRPYMASIPPLRSLCHYNAHTPPPVYILLRRDTHAEVLASVYRNKCAEKFLCLRILRVHSLNNDAYKERMSYSRQSSADGIGADKTDINTLTPATEQTCTRCDTLKRRASTDNKVKERFNTHIYCLQHRACINPTHFTHPPNALRQRRFGYSAVEAMGKFCHTYSRAVYLHSCVSIVRRICFN